MPVILTKKFAESKFFIQTGMDKKEGIFATPMHETRAKKLMQEVEAKCGGDDTAFREMYPAEFLATSIYNWSAYTDVQGNDIPFTVESLKEVCTYDPEHAGTLLYRIKNIARYGEVVDEKN